MTKEPDPVSRPVYEAAVKGRRDFRQAYREADIDRKALLDALLKVRDSFLFTDDDGSTGVESEAERHHFDLVCDVINRTRAKAANQTRSNDDRTDGKPEGTPS